MSKAAYIGCREHPKPWLHVFITDVIIFGPFLGIPWAVIDLVRHPVHNGWEFALGAFLFLMFGIKIRTLGISLGFHRQGTHPSYETYPWLRAFFFMCGSATAQGKMCNWLTDHHHHHLNSDQEEDLHSPKDGFWHAYIGWLRGLLFDRPVYERFQKDRQVMFFSRTFWVWLVIGLLVPVALGVLTGFGVWRGVLYGGVLSILCANQVTYWVNAGCHTYGKQDFNTGDQSTNFWIKGPLGWIVSMAAAYLSWGETNHNNHHARAISANHGMFKGQFDPSANLLHILEWVGLVWNVQWTTREEAVKLQRSKALSPEERKMEALAAHRARQEGQSISS